MILKFDPLFCYLFRIVLIDPMNYNKLRPMDFFLFLSLFLSKISYYKKIYLFHLVINVEYLQHQRYSLNKYIFFKKLAIHLIYFKPKLITFAILKLHF